MAKKSYDEKLEEIRVKQEQLRALERDMKKRHAENERRIRTKRLIELGAIIESVLGRETTEEDKVRLMNFLKKQENNGKYFTNAMNARGIL